MSTTTTTTSTKSFEPAKTFECDRRLSRAARELMKRRLLPLLWPHSPGISSTTSNENLDDVLRQTIRSEPSSAACMLHPDRDVLLQDEIHSKRIPAGISRMLPRKRASHWYQCGYCGKVFLTRYYLDLHLEMNHRHNNTTNIMAVNDRNELVCPATEYCQILGGCDHEALELEPFYGRGSGGFGPDAIQVRQIWSRRLEPCHEATLQDKSQPACRQVLRTCFQNNGGKDDDDELVEKLIAGVCDSLTCHNRLHQMAGHVIRHVHTWKHEWQVHAHNQGSVGWFGLVLVVALMGYYTFAYAKRRRMTGAQPKNRLLSKRATRSPSSRKWNVLGGSTQSKRKLH